MVLDLTIIILIALILIASFIDLRSQIIPDLLTLPGILLGVVLTVMMGKLSLGEAILGVVLPGFVMLIIAVMTRGGMGGGDVKLLAMIGSFIGWRGALIALFWGSVAGSIVGLALIILRKRKRREPIPFGPFLAVGALLFLGGWRYPFT